jgi:chemotaxis methyl-accepting protein methylase
VTSFFRDAQVFARLNEDVFAPLADRPGPIRVWSAGCSDGSELYSVAILLAELGLLDRALLLGTDCRTNAVRRAALGTYNADEMLAVPVEWRAKYFRPVDGGSSWRVRDDLRAASQFRAGNLATTTEPGAFDLICCRNLAIYLRSDVVGALWTRLQDALRPGGC